MDHLGLYLHIPFCDGRCNYCNFYRTIGNTAEYDRYTDQMQRTIKNFAARYPRTVSSVYFGGGTPSVLGDYRLSSLLTQIRTSFSLSMDAEITLEVNPCSGEALCFDRLKDAGFNRLSIGLQSSDEDQLAVLGRRHTAALAASTVRRAQQAGFDNISLDLMLAIPYQTPASLCESIRFCATCDVQHISAYILKVEEGTPFFRFRDTLPRFSDEQQAELYELAVSELMKYGYDQYEISNFCRKGYESRHNLCYWHDEEYLGLGPSAHSYVDGERFYFADHLEDFYAGRTIYESSGGDREEYIMLALRLREGLIFSRYKERYGDDIPRGMLSAAEKLADAGLLILDDSHLHLTTKGMLVSNSVIAYLLEHFEKT